MAALYKELVCSVLGRAGGLCRVSRGQRWAGYPWEEQSGAGEVGDPFARCLRHGGSCFPVGLGQGRILHKRGDQCPQPNLAQKSLGIKGTDKGARSQTSTP